MGAPWARHAMCESAFIWPAADSYSLLQAAAAFCVLHILQIWMKLNFHYVPVSAKATEWHLLQLRHGHDTDSR